METIAEAPAVKIQDNLASTMPELKERSPSELTFGTKVPKKNKKMHDVFYHEGEPGYNFVTNQYYDFDRIEQYKTPPPPPDKLPPKKITYDNISSEVRDII